MRVAFCIYKYFPHGGIQRDLLKMARECLSRGHQVRIYVIHWNAPLPEKEMELHIVQVQAFSNHRLYELFADHVLTHVTQHPVDLLVGMNKMPGLDVYYAGDSCYEEKARNQRNALYRTTPRYKHFALFERSVFDPLVRTRILTISDVQMPCFRRYYNTPVKRFHALPPGIEADRIAPPDKQAIRAAFRQELELADDEWMLLFVGSGFIKKGLDRVLLALKALPPEIFQKIHLFVIGKDNAEPFRRMAVRLGVIERVRFFAEGRNDVPRFMFSADGLLLPAYDENAGMVILEAMFAGLPALVTANCGYARYLAEADAGLIAQLPFNQHTFNSQVVELLTSPSRSQWQVRGVAMAERPELFMLAQKAVDYLETFAAQKKPVIGFALFKYFPFGGLQRDFLRVALECLRRGYAVRVYTLSWEGELPEGIDLVEVPVTAITNHSRYERFARWVQKDLRWRPVSTLIGFNKMPGLDLYYAADPCFEHKAQQLRPPMYRRTRRYKLFSRFEQAVFEPQMDVDILFIADQQKMQFQKFYDTPENRLHILPPGVSPGRRRMADAQAQRERFRAAYGLQEDDVLLLLIGSGFVTKGVDRAMLAVAALPEDLRQRVQFFIIGQDQPKQFQQLAQELGIAERVTIFDGRDDIPLFLNGADIMIHPAYLESGGIVLLEAMIFGLPVIATDVCGFSSYVTEADAGELIRSPFQQEVFNETLTRAIRDPQQRKLWSGNGIRFGETADIYRMAESAVDLIEERSGA